MSSSHCATHHCATHHCTTHHCTIQLCRGTHRRRHTRRGAVALLAVWMMVIFLLITAWVLNYNFLVLVNRNMQQKCDAIVLAAAADLLDEDVLRDYPGPPTANQTDDFAEALATAEQYRRWNNRGQSAKLVLHRDDVTVRSGYVADITGRSPFHFDTSIPLNEPTPPHNTLLVRSRRSPEGNHPVRYVMDLFNGGTRRTADVSSGAYATLDNLLVGFRPGAEVASPVIPLGIDVAAWNTERALGGDGNTNRIREMVLRLETPRGKSNDGNASLLFFDGQVNVNVLSSQMSLGLFSGHLPPHGELGPVTAASPLSVSAMRRVNRSTYPTLNAELAQTLSGLVDAGEAKRVFPLYDTFHEPDKNGDDDDGKDGRGGNGIARLVGFVAAEILLADVADDRLIVVIEPCFIIHHTAWTVAANHASQPHRNLYIHKLRLSR